MDFIKATRVRIVFFTLFTFYSLSRMHCGELDTPVYIQYVDEITESVIKEIESELGIFCSGQGGSMPYDVSEIELLFVSFHKTSIDEARKLEVIANEKLLKAINNHEKIRPYLKEYPFKANRANISISFRDSEGSHQSEGVALVFQVNNKIFYEGKIKEPPYLDTLKEEPYEEAVKIVISNKESENANKR